VEGPVELPVRHTLTPAVLASIVFVVLCAAVAIAFVAARGGLQMPVAASSSQSAAPSGDASAVPATPAPTPVAATPAPTVAPSAPPATPTLAPPTSAPTAAPTPFDPLFALPPCPDHPGCYEYLIARGDSLSGVASRYAIPVSTVLALNPEIIDPSTIVVGQILYLGRDPFARLEACPDTVSCWLYTVRPGDTLSTVAGRFGLTVQAILDANPAITDENAIFSGQVLRLKAAEG
jgi:hypothetical protein